MKNIEIINAKLRNMNILLGNFDIKLDNSKGI